ncbi:MAG: hypothetical protein PHE73_09240 [Sulfurovaceae bacterium]|nr:hypothetical protein [Sulfurovaceae bacterium]
MKTKKQGEKEICICAAIKTRSGKIVLGHRHSDCIYTAKRMGWALQDLSFTDQGFITSKNRFVDRWEAFRIAKRAKQVKSNYDIKELFSEDLY